MLSRLTKCFLGNHTVAVIKGAESYELLQTSCSDVFRDVKKLIKEKVINIDGQNIEVEICMGGDYKVNKSHC